MSPTILKDVSLLSPKYCTPPFDPMIDEFMLCGYQGAVGQKYKISNSIMGKERSQGAAASMGF
jgi:hypothetical protein